MAEWFYEAGIGECRAALIEDGVIIEALIESGDSGPRVGDVIAGKFIGAISGGRMGLVRLFDGTQAVFEPLLSGFDQGRTHHFRVIRAAIAEPGTPKRAKVRLTDAALATAPSLFESLDSCLHRLHQIMPHQPDRLEAAGWSECLDEAARGIVMFDGGALRISPTPAMTLIDVDGWLPPATLAIAAARAAAAAIRRFDIGGSIGIDFPTLGGKNERLAVSDCFDKILPKPFERTALNGFGFMQIIRPRVRASLIEHLRYDPVAAAARALLRRTQRSGIIGALEIIAPDALADMLEQRDWLTTLARDCGGTVSLRRDPSLAMSAAYARHL